MLHAPLNGALAPSFGPLSGTSLGNQTSDDRNVLHTIIPPFLPQTLPISMNQSGVLSQPFTIGNGARNIHSSLALGIDAVTSLSDSSSLSSSLVSLHSTPTSNQSLSNNSCQLLATSLDLQLPPGPRCSLWLKLRVCPSWLISSVNTQVKTTLPASMAQDVSVLSNSSSVIEEKTKSEHPSSEESTISCPLFPVNCPYAHPSPNVRVEAGYVTVCYDFVKRKNCKHSCCKYYHPPPHQIEPILKRGDEQKKLMETQQRLLETKVSTYMKMQPSQPSAPNGLSAVSPGTCTTNLPWPLASPLQPTITPSLYGTYLSAGQTLSGPLNPLVPFPTSYVSTTDPNSLNATTFLAAAAALQQHTLNATSLFTSSAKTTPVNGSAPYATTSADQHMSTCHSTPLAYSLTNGHCTSVPSRPVSVSEQQLISAGVQAGSLPSPALTVPAPARIDALPPSIAVNAANLENETVIPTPSSATTTTAIITLVSTVKPEALPIIANPTAVSTTRAVSHHSGMKREANSSLSSSSCAVALDMHSWCPAKRPNRSVTDLLPDSAESTEISGILCNGLANGQRNDCSATPATVSMNENATSLAACLSMPSTCSSALAGASVAQSGVSGLLNPVNLYGLPFSNHQTLAPSFLGAPVHLNYSSMYPNQGTPDAATSAAALAFNTWLPQQMLSPQVPLHQTAQPNPSLAVAMAAFQPQQSPSDLSTAAPSSPLAFQQQQQQQAVLLSLLLRAQQSQLAAAQLAAAVQATGTTGLLQATSPSRSAFAGLSNACILDSSFPYPGTLNGLTTNPYGATMSSLQNPITNVAYVNDKGHLLETLPICRDFKAGKCHRNADCRYVHLVDEYVEVNQGRVIVCRDAAKGRCTRVPCKYYHVPLLAISANRSLALNSALATAGVPANPGL